MKRPAQRRTTGPPSCTPSSPTFPRKPVRRSTLDSSQRRNGPKGESQRVILVARITESEHLRVEQEQARLTAESERMREEQQRADAELIRAQNEELRISREKNRAENYVARTFLPGPGSSSGLHPPELLRSALFQQAPITAPRPTVSIPAAPPAWSRTPFVPSREHPAAASAPVFPPPALLPRPTNPAPPPPTTQPCRVMPPGPTTVNHHPWGPSLVRPPGTELYPAGRPSALPPSRTFPGRTKISM